MIKFQNRIQIYITINPKSYQYLSKTIIRNFKQFETIRILKLPIRLNLDQNNQIVEIFFNCHRHFDGTKVAKFFFEGFINLFYFSVKSSRTVDEIFLVTNKTRNDIYYRIEVLWDHVYLCMLLFSLCTGVFYSRLLSTSNFFSRASFCIKQSSAKVKKITKLYCKYCWRIITLLVAHFIHCLMLITAKQCEQWQLLKNYA